jgi:hypothetical protein
MWAMKERALSSTLWASASQPRLPSAPRVTARPTLAPAQPLDGEGSDTGLVPGAGATSPSPYNAPADNQDEIDELTDELAGLKTQADCLKKMIADLTRQRNLMLPGSSTWMVLNTMLNGLKASLVAVQTKIKAVIAQLAALSG